MQQIAEKLKTATADREKAVQQKQQIDQDRETVLKRAMDTAVAVRAKSLMKDAREQLHAAMGTKPLPKTAIAKRAAPAPDLPGSSSSKKKKTGK